MADKDQEIEIIITTRYWEKLEDPDALTDDVKAALTAAGFNVRVVDIEGV